MSSISQQASPGELYKHVLDLNGPRALDPTLSDSLSQTELRGSPNASPNNPLAEMNLCVAFVARLLGRKSQVLLMATCRLTRL